MYRNLPKIGSIASPRLTFQASANSSSRHGRPIQVLFLHRWGSLDYTYEGVLNTLTKKGTGVSSHAAYPGMYSAQAGKHGGTAKQLVPWAEKAWTECDLNPIGLSIECADAIWLGQDPEGFAQLARMVALILHQRAIPVRWVRGAALIHGGRGHARHADGGHLACGHDQCPTTDLHLYEQFHERVLAETRHGKFRKTAYGRMN